MLGLPPQLLGFFLTQLLTPHASACRAEDLQRQSRAIPAPQAGTHVAPAATGAAAAAGGTEPQDRAPKPRYCHAPSAAALIYLETAQDSGGGGFAVNLCLPWMVFFCFPSPQLIWIGCPLPLPEFTAGIRYKHWALALLFWWSFKAHFYYGMARAKASRYKQHNGNGLRLMGKL